VLATASEAGRLNFVTQGIYLWAIGMVKVSIGLFLLRFAPKKGYKIFIWVVIGSFQALHMLKLDADCGSGHDTVYIHLLLGMYLPVQMLAQG
jgi:hypothetical protein